MIIFFISAFIERMDWQNHPIVDRLISPILCYYDQPIKYNRN